jgi:hypothetical protein
MPTQYAASESDPRLHSSNLKYPRDWSKSAGRTTAVILRQDMDGIFSYEHMTTSSVSERRVVPFSIIRLPSRRRMQDVEPHVELNIT